MTLMKLSMLVMRGNLLRMVGDDEVGRSREQGVDLGRRRFYFWTDYRRNEEDKVDVNDGEVDQPSRVGSPSAVGGVHLQGARLPSDEPVQLVKAGVLTIQFRGFVPFVKV